MYVDAHDKRPPSMLTAEVFNGKMLVGGAIIALLAHVVIPGAVVLGMGLLAVTGMAETEPTDYLEDKVVEARFVRLGKKRDPDKLPNRRVNKLQTAPDKKTVVSKNMKPKKVEKPDAGPEPERPVEDDLLRLGDRAQMFAEIADEMEQEGDPDGVEWGTETEAQLGDIYRGKLVAFFKRGWTIPTTLGDTSKLVVVAEVKLTADLKVGPSEILKPSGDPLFDQSVEDRFEQLRSLGTSIPEPPIEQRDMFLGKKITVRFRGKPQ
ncbi:MAG: TonB C-terminal domain-containing protein [Myxococcales bacterium]|jgi:hypothetical protein